MGRQSWGLLPHFFEDTAGFDDAGIYYTVIDVQAIAAGGDQPGMAKHGQMLGNVGLFQLQHIYQVFHGGLLVLDSIEDLQTDRIGQDLVDFGVAIVDVLGKG